MSRPALSVLVHPDPLRLEAELAERVWKRQGTPEGIASVLVAVPSSHQVRRVRESLAQRHGAVVGVDVVQYQTLSRRIVERSNPGLRLATTPLIEALVDRILAGESELAISRYARGRPAAVRNVTRLLLELREGGYRARDLEATLPGNRELARVLRRLEEILDSASGRTDRAGLTRRAAAIAPGLPPCDAVLAYGAYELVGMHLDLILAVPARAPHVFLVPADPRAPAWAYARSFIERHLGVEPERLPDAEPGRPAVAVARTLRDREPETFPELEAGRVSLAHAQGPESELNVAVREALALIRSGDAAPHEIGIVARSLDPYVPVAESVFERHGLQVESSIKLPLSRFLVPRSLTLLLRALGGDFERQPVIELVRSPVLERGSMEENAWWPGAWDQWSRTYGIVRGAGSWLELPDLIRDQKAPPWTTEDPEGLARFREQTDEHARSAEVLAGLVARWQEEIARWEECRSAGEHAGFIRGLASRWIHGWDEPRGDERTVAVRKALDVLLEDLEGLAWAAPADGNGFTIGEIADFVTRSIGELSIPWRNPSGVHFLDLMQARGLTFRHLFLIGFNERLMPRQPREDPFLPDPDRQALRSRTGKPLAVRREGREEEWLLFAQTVASATGTLRVSWQRADGEGKAASPSLFLRELARFLPGSPSLRDVLEHRSTPEPERIPTHPGDAATWLRDGTGMLTLEEAALLTCQSAGPEAVDALRKFLEEEAPQVVPDVDAGLELVRRTEAFDGGGDLIYDGGIPGGTGWDRPFSQSSLRALARCPQTFFFRHVLGVKPLEEAAKDFRLEARELGNSMHRILEQVFGELDEEGVLDGDTPPDARLEAARAALDRHWNPVLEPVRQRLETRFPLLFAHAESFWRQEIEEFLARDLARLAGIGHRIEYLEDPWPASISFSEESLTELRKEFGLVVPTGIRVFGVPDRVTRDGEGNWMISDYKTSGKLTKEVDPKEYLTGRRIQLPLYTLMAGPMGAEGEVEAELLGLGPVFSEVAGVEPDRRAGLSGEDFANTRTGFEETLAVLATVASHGRFPFNDGHHCTWCRFTTACRKNHFPSRERVREDPANATYFLIEKKSKTKSTLDRLDRGDGDA